MLKRIIFILIVLCLATSRGWILATSANAQSAPAQTGNEKEVSFVVRNAFFQKYGIAWAAATEEQKKLFLKELKEQDRRYNQDYRSSQRYHRQRKKEISQKKREKEKAERAYQRQQQMIKRAEEKKRAEIRKRNRKKKKF